MLRLPTRSLLGLALLIPVLLPAQDRDRSRSRGEQATPAARMRALIRYLAGDGEEGDSLQSYFPATAEWRWVHRLRGGRAGSEVVVWHFQPADTRRALADDGPVCPALGMANGEFSSREGSLASAAESPGVWRHTGGNRFVPPGAGTASPVFVEWQREGERWVIAALGDVGTYRTGPTREAGNVLKLALPAVSLSLPLPDSTAVATERGWYGASEPILAFGSHAIKYGLPRRLGSGELVRIGEVDGVPAFAELLRGRRPEVIYLAQDRDGMFQPYQAFAVNCSWGWEYR